MVLMPNTTSNHAVSYTEKPITKASNLVAEIEIGFIVQCRNDATFLKKTN